MFMSTMFIVILMFIVIDFWVNLLRDGQTAKECWECKIYVRVWLPRGIYLKPFSAFNTHYTTTSLYICIWFHFIPFLVYSFDWNYVIITWKMSRINFPKAYCTDWGMLYMFNIVLQDFYFYEICLFFPSSSI